MNRPFMFRDPIAAKAGPAKLDLWLDFSGSQVLLCARHEGDDAEQNLAVIGFDEEDGNLYIQSLPLMPGRKDGHGDRVRNLRRLLPDGRLIELQAGEISDVVKSTEPEGTEA
ncbi:MAG: hypothetical protein Q8R81_09580 [Novosphingobium sp.]|uniref:hypothetical protein n=1 Tax=Novosphingobium sp. TaxID=1874826 RepID=UPI0027327A86|nr:hypothetical protein [Novosphingobium sp.]MDP3550635.1 hypothetical protein [Novosphingobium sp.]